MAEPWDNVKDLSEETKVVTIVEEPKQDGHGAPPLLTPAPLQTLGRGCHQARMHPSDAGSTSVIMAQPVARADGKPWQAARAPRFGVRP